LRSYEPGVYGRAVAVLLACYVVVSAVVGLLPWDDEWASELSMGTRIADGLIVALVYVAVPTMLVTFLTFAVLAWYATTPAQLRAGWIGALVVGAFAALVVTDLDPSIWWVAVPVSAHVLAAIAAPLVVR
jgi:hypothetical protein